MTAEFLHRYDHATSNGYVYNTWQRLLCIWLKLDNVIAYTGLITVAKAFNWCEPISTVRAIQHAPYTERKITKNARETTTADVSKACDDADESSEISTCTT